ncbi:MAG: helix-turn-helix domain-containing protein [Flavobacteriaceae bacterium]|nr:helix-turn-helix domain-containing protein [Flavobacteriaceae bacterium]
MKDKPNYYAVIPANVRYDGSLTPNAKLLYAEITALCNMNGKCCASTSYFAELYEVSRVSIQKWLKLLEDKNYIKRSIVYKEGSKQIETRYITLVNNPNKQKLTDNSNININNTNLTDSNSVRFKKPILDEIKIYCLERNNNINFETFYDFYESKNWMIGKNKMKDWKAAIRNWERREKTTISKIDSQLNEYQKGKELL